MDEAEGKGFDADEAFPVLTMRDMDGGTELLVPNIKKKLTWVHRGKVFKDSPLWQRALK